MCSAQSETEISLVSEDRDESEKSTNISGLTNDTKHSKSSLPATAGSLDRTETNSSEQLSSLTLPNNQRPSLTLPTPETFPTVEHLPNVTPTVLSKPNLTLPTSEPFPPEDHLPKLSETGPDIRISPPDTTSLSNSILSGVKVNLTPKPGRADPCQSDLTLENLIHKYLGKIVSTAHIVS